MDSFRNNQLSVENESPSVIIASDDIQPSVENASPSELNEHDIELSSDLVRKVEASHNIQPSVENTLTSVLNENQAHPSPKQSPNPISYTEPCTPRLDSD